MKRRWVLGSGLLLVSLLVEASVQAQAQFMDSTGALADDVSQSEAIVKIFGLIFSMSAIWLAVERSGRALAGCIIVCLCGAGWRYGPEIMAAIMG